MLQAQLKPALSVALFICTKSTYLFPSLRLFVCVPKLCVYYIDLTAKVYCIIVNSMPIKEYILVFKRSRSKPFKKKTYSTVTTVGPFYAPAKPISGISVGLSTTDQFSSAMMPRVSSLGFLFSCPRVLSCTQFSPAP
jgi:hypothetical protein